MLKKKKLFVFDRNKKIGPFSQNLFIYFNIIFIRLKKFENSSKKTKYPPKLKSKDKTQMLTNFFFSKESLILVLTSKSYW
jgi:hypothetical protein